MGWTKIATRCQYVFVVAAAGAAVAACGSSPAEPAPPVGGVSPSAGTASMPQPANPATAAPAAADPTGWIGVWNFGFSAGPGVQETRAPGSGLGIDADLAFTDSGLVNPDSLLDVHQIAFLSAVNPPNADDAFTAPPGHRILAMTLQLNGRQLTPPVTWVDLTAGGVTVRVGIGDDLPANWHELGGPVYRPDFPNSPGDDVEDRLAFVVPDNATTLTLTASNGRGKAVPLGRLKPQ